MQLIMITRKSALVGARTVFYMIQVSLLLWRQAQIYEDRLKSYPAYGFLRLITAKKDSWLRKVLLPFV